MPRFTIGETDFLLDGQPFQVLAGAVHYFRVHPEQWRDRIAKARDMGLNTVETYVAWNEHSPEPGRFDADGRLDLGRFLDVVAEEGMLAIVRPGPYICAEWDGGGLPGWLFRDGDVGIRTLEPRYMAAVSRYLAEVYRIVAPRQIDRGGPVVLVQIENEYGAYGDDSAYLAELVRLTREHGIEVPLTSIDQPIDEMLVAGSIPGLHKTGSFGSRVTERLAILRAHQPTGPLMCSEFWCGWFDHWGAHHHTTDASESAAELAALLATGASVSIYMFHGGTNFGFTSGANDKGVYQPTVTSYDYDSPLDESGEPTAKYAAFREVIAARTGAAFAPLAIGGRHPAPQAAVALHPVMGLIDALPADDAWARSEHPPTFDDCGVYRGLLVHRTELTPDTAGSTDTAVLDLGEVRDRAQVFLDGERVGVLSRSDHGSRLVLPRRGGELTVLVEDQGRVNYGPRIGEPKGLIGGVRLDGEPVTGWRTAPVDVDGVVRRAESSVGEARTSEPTVPSGPIAGPVVLAGAFDLNGPADLFLDTHSLGKGVAFVNGWPLGRYWRRGPQRTLYVPGPVVRAGRNTLVVVELESTASSEVRFVAAPDLGHTEW